jgi:hypothetical protein
VALPVERPLGQRLLSGKSTSPMLRAGSVILGRLHALLVNGVAIPALVQVGEGGSTFMYCA